MRHTETKQEGGFLSLYIQNLIRIEESQEAGLVFILMEINQEHLAALVSPMRIQKVSMMQ